jgi:hypothetical protein
MLPCIVKHSEEIHSLMHILLHVSLTDLLTHR